ncbi:MAG: dihydroneopterin aldolase [Thiotrichales bacterium]|nr:dihydroneopterin aldolase [Thiotrichales bacterium]
MRTQDHDVIYIEGLQTTAIIGIYDWERAQAQPLIFDVEMAVPLFTAARSDRIEDTVDYKAVADFIGDWVSTSRFELLEALMDSLCQALFTEFPAILQLDIKVGKPQAVAQARTVGLQLRRNNPQIP